MDKEQIKEWWLGFKHRLKVFFWYLATEPLRQTKELAIGFVKMFTLLNKTLTWAYIFFGAAIYFLWQGNRFAAGVLFICMVIVILLWEWADGAFMHKYRQHIKDKAKKEIEKQKGETNEDERS